MEKISGDEIKRRILEVLKKNEWMNTRQISNKIGVSYPTTLKWVDILYAEGKIDIKHYGNVKIVSLKNG